MKKIISIVGALVLISAVAFAQPQHNKKGNHKGGEEWREKVRAEQVAFITAELDLTEAEAQAFWPVYNDVQKQRREAFKACADATKALQDGLEGPDVAKLLDQYVDCKKASEKVDADALPRYKKVLPIEKVAKLVLAEEKFRHQQIGKLGGKGGNHPGPGGPKAPNGQPLPPSPVQE